MPGRSFFSLDRFFETKRRDSLAYLRQLGASPDDAEDIFQKTALALLKRSSKRPLPENLWAFWLTSLRRAYWQQGRRRRPTESLQCDDGERETLLLDPSPTPEAQVCIAEVRQLVHQKIREIRSREQVETLLLSLNGYGIEEIARRLNIPQGTVKWRLHASRRKLRKRLARYFEEEPVSRVV